MRGNMLRFLYVYLCLLAYLPLHANAQMLNLQQSTEVNSPIWRQVNLNTPKTGEQVINAYLGTQNSLVSLSEMRGPAIAKIPLSTNTPTRWFILPNANYLDEGFAYWQDSEGIRLISDFSQGNLSQSAIIMHGQAFQLNLKANSQGVLWLYLNANHYAKPVSVAIIDEPTFIYQQFFVNSLSIMSITIMLTLACMALILYLKTGQNVALYCAGYIGLHGIGWAFAAGVFGVFYSFKSINSHYLGMYIFSFAISSASAFAYYLFNFHTVEKTRISQFLKYFSYAAFISGFINLVLPFHWVFYLAHTLAAIWVVLTLVLGFKMLSLNDFRAKYFLTGNIIYSLSLVVFILAHLNLIVTASAELWVLIALAIDCICILLSLSEWLKIKQNDYIDALEQSRIDPLTKVGNRLLLQEKLNTIGTFYLIVFIDCDGMKSINDQLGHASGDELLINVTKLIKKGLANLGDVYRTGGDEFICLCNADSLENLAVIESNTAKALNKVHIQLQQKWPESGLSFGIASSNECTDYKACFTLADERMYAVKYARKNSTSNSQQATQQT